jgi:diadenosine tetraphosphatase ApaH/serine/threonine PP2A family protein phosphatase
MADELDRLVTALAPVTGDRFLFLGDLVDKGPESLGVLRRIRDLMARFPGSFSICGNHEESAIRLNVKALKAGTWTGIGKAEKETWLTQATAEDFAFLASFPLYARPFGDRSVLMVHGGLFPAYFEHYSGLPILTPWWQTEKGKQMDRARRFLRVRHVSATGDMVTLGEEGETTRPWTDWYDGREGTVFYGHAPQRSGEPLVRPHSVGLDTGAVFGGRLTAAVLSPATEVRMVSVPAHGGFSKWLEDASEE